MNSKKAIIITCFVAILWSLSGINIKMINWDSISIAGGRSAVAAIFFQFYIKRKGLKIKIDRYTLGGAVCFIAFNYCFILSSKLAGPTTAIMMQYTAPIYVAILSYIFFKENIRKSDLICIIVVILGMVLFFSDQESNVNFFGNLIAIFNGITFAGMAIFFRLQRNNSPEISVYLGNVGASIIGIPFMFSSSSPDLSSVLFIILAGLLSAITYALYAKVSIYLSALETVLIPIIDPILNPVWVFFFLGEKPGNIAILGSIIVLISVTSKVLYGLKKQKISPMKAS